jgi:hypothetical protein
MAGDRRAGGVHFTNIAGPKVFRTKTPDGYQLGLGFAGSPRVVQTVLAVAPPRLDHHGRLHPWLTSYCDSIHEVCAERGALASSDSDGARLAGETDFLLAIEGRVFRVGEDLAWEEPARGWECVGSGSYSWQGAFAALRSESNEDGRDLARRAWVIAQDFHAVGDLLDEIEVPA